MSISKAIVQIFNSLNNVFNALGNTIHNGKVLIIKHANHIDRLTNFILIFLPLILAYLAQLFFYNVHDVFNHYFLTKPFKEIFFRFDPGLSFDIGIVLYFLALLIVYFIFKNETFLKKSSLQLSNKNTKTIKIGIILILSITILIIHSILFVSLGIYHQYSIILAFLWLISIASLIAIGIIIDKQLKLSCLSSFKMTKKELFFTGCTILFLLAFGVTALDIIPNVMTASGDGIRITNTAYSTFQNILTVNIFSNSCFCHVPNLGMLLKGIFFPLLPDNFLAGRYTSIIAGSLTVIPFYLLTRNMFNQFVAIIAMISMCTNYLYLLYEKIAIFPAYVIFFFILSLLFFVSSLKSKNYTFIILSGLLGGLAAYTWGGGIIIIASIGMILLYLLITNLKQWDNIFKIGSLFVISFLIVLLPLFFNSFKYTNNQGCFDSAVSTKTILNNKLINRYKKKYNTDSFLHIVLQRTFEGVKIFSIQNAENGAPYVTITQSVFFFFSIIFFLLFRKRNLNLTLIMITFLSVIFFGGVLSEGFKIKRISLAIPFISILSSIAIFMYAQKIKNCFKSKKIQQIVFGLILFVFTALILINNITHSFTAMTTQSMPRDRYILGQYIKTLSKNNHVYTVNFTEAPKNLYKDTKVDLVEIHRYTVGERAVFKPDELVYSKIKFDPIKNELITEKPLSKGNICFIYPKEYNYLITNYLIKRFGEITYVQPDRRWGSLYSVAILKNNNT